MYMYIAVLDMVSMYPCINNYYSHRLSSLARGGRVFSRRLIERRHDRMSRTILGRVPNFVPAAEVPEDLIEEAMAVLQGKTRDVVIRELQRTVSKWCIGVKVTFV